jgi:DNA (cytosine-5)-methyltransferase 1
MEGGGLEPHTAIPMILSGHTAEEKKLSPCLNANDSIKVFGTGQPHAACGVKKFGIDYNAGGKERQIANTVTTRNVMAGVTNINQDGTAVCIPVLTPDRAEKRQNGRRFKDNGEEAFTLTAQDKHGVALGVLRTVRSEYGKAIRKEYESGNLDISRHTFLEHEIRQDGISNTIDSVQKDNILALKIREATAKGFAEAEIGDSVNLSMPESKTRRGRVGKKQANTLDTSCEQGVIVPVPVIWYDKYKCYIAIRKLTPKECFRLQGWTDEYFEKAQFVNSDSQLYKQAGNGVTVTVVEDIGKRLKEV